MVDGFTFDVSSGLLLLVIHREEYIVLKRVVEDVGEARNVIDSYDEGKRAEKKRGKLAMYKIVM